LSYCYAILHQMDLNKIFYKILFLPYSHLLGLHQLDRWSVIAALFVLFAPQQIVKI
jgi:hypothetical protein